MNKERKRVQTDERCRQARDETRLSVLRIWDQHVLPNWDQVIQEPRIRELWWRGIPPRSRGLVWQRAMQNELELTERSYEAALKRAKDAEGDDDDGHHQRGREREWFYAIRRDAEFTFPELKIFQANGPLHDSLVDVLMAHAMYRPDVGYLHGTHVS